MNFKQLDDHDRAGTFLTYAGHTINFLDFRVEDVRLEEIAHALSRLCRFGGHCREHYNVAHHAVLVSRWLEEKGAPLPVVYAGLHHDDTEAYLGDVISPLKKLLPEYQKFEDRFAKVIGEALGFAYPFPDLLKTADREIFYKENEDVRWQYPKNPEIIPWNSGVSKYLYLETHKRLKEQLEL
jgi:5'-deoxynucleotidase YfbR-like HD superfamily hydrolase